MRLSKAPRKVFPHKDVAALREILREAAATGRADGAGPYRLILVVTDGVFSMDGDIAPLPEIVEAAEEVGAAVFVDDAHASGVLGRDGRGSVDHFGLHGRVDIQVGTMSKAMGVLGGYVASTQALRELLIQRARPFLFSTSHPPADAAACREAIRVMQDEPWRIERLWASTKRFKAELTRLGFDTGRSETPITPIIVGDSEAAIRFSGRLFEEGVFATSVVFPTVALDQARLRTIVTAALSDEHLDRALDAFGRVGRELRHHRRAVDSPEDVTTERRAFAEPRRRWRSLVGLDPAGGRARRGSRPPARRPPPHRPVAGQLRPDRRLRGACRRARHPRDRDHRPRRLRLARSRPSSTPATRIASGSCAARPSAGRRRASSSGSAPS